tara:strand:- start:8788 stop:9744 length:957 start_codon:yes stop_codon:yes gene_type:complete
MTILDRFGDISPDRMKVLKSIAANYSIDTDSAMRVVQNTQPFVLKVSGEYLTPKRMEKAAQIYAAVGSLFPGTILVHGSGEPLSKELGHTRKHHGTRITFPQEIPVVVGVATKLTERLVDRINFYGGNARGICHDPKRPAFHFQKSDWTEDDNGNLVYLGEVGIVPRGREESAIARGLPGKLTTLIRDGYMPVIGPVVHDSESSNPLNPDADDIARVVAHNMGYGKIIFVTENRNGGRFDQAAIDEHIQRRGTENPEDALQKHNGNWSWKFQSVIEAVLNGNTVAMVKQENLFPSIFSDRPKDFAELVLSRRMLDELK